MPSIVFQQNLHTQVTQKIRLPAGIRAKTASCHKQQNESLSESVTAAAIERGVVRQRAHGTVIVDLAHDFELRRELMPRGETQDPFGMRPRIPRKK